MTRTGRGGVLLAALLLAGVTGCGDSADQALGERPAASAQPGAVAALKAAERATGRAGSARVESATTLGTDVSMTSSGRLAWADGLSGALTITYTGGSVAETMRELGSTSMQARYVGDAYYARMGEAFAAKAGGRHWIRYGWGDLADLGGASGAPLAAQIRDAAPHRCLKLLLAGGDVRRVGTETVRGERTTHYRGTARTADGAAQTVDLWIDGDDLLVKKVEKVDQGDSEGGAVTQTSYYDDYGVRVSVQPPPAADTRDFRELIVPEGN
ncbi:hypothetical protein [Streptomyces sp. enrichment culture]|uniref:hypothetical protein n=1 Tax=Streptomyces sp. enrichment culture TaxID=1795815 RepID=UPI003F56BD86